MAHNNTTQKHFKPIIIISWLWVVGWWRSTLVKFEEKNNETKKKNYRFCSLSSIWCGWEKISTSHEISARLRQLRSKKNRVEFKLESFCIARGSIAFLRGTRRLKSCVVTSKLIVCHLRRSTRANWNSRRLDTQQKKRFVDYIFTVCHCPNSPEEKKTESIVVFMRFRRFCV